MKTKNAGLKNQEEAIHALVDGREFYYNNMRIWFDISRIEKGQSAFRCNDAYLKGFFEFFQDWEEEINWWEEDGIHTLCWTGDSEDIL